MARQGWQSAKIRPANAIPVPCPAGDTVYPGEWQIGQRKGNWYRVWHEDCAEDVGAYGEDYAIGGKYRTEE